MQLSLRLALAWRPPLVPALVLSVSGRGVRMLLRPSCQLLPVSVLLCACATQHDYRMHSLLPPGLQSMPWCAAWLRMLRLCPKRSEEKRRDRELTAKVEKASLKVKLAVMLVRRTLVVIDGGRVRTMLQE